MFWNGTIVTDFLLRNTVRLCILQGSLLLSASGFLGVSLIGATACLVYHGKVCRCLWKRPDWAARRAQVVRNEVDEGGRSRSKTNISQ